MLTETMTILINLFSSRKEKNELAERRFHKEYSRTKHYPSQLECLFCQMTGQKYARYQDICFIMNHKNRSKLLDLSKKVNYIRRPVEFNEKGACVLNKSCSKTEILIIGFLAFLFITLSFGSFFFCFYGVYWTFSNPVSIFNSLGLFFLVIGLLFLIFCIFFSYASMKEYLALLNAYVFQKIYNEPRIKTDEADTNTKDTD